MCAKRRPRSCGGRAGQGVEAQRRHVTQSTGSHEFVAHAEEAEEDLQERQRLEAAAVAHEDEGLRDDATHVRVERVGVLHEQLSQLEGEVRELLWERQRGNKDGYNAHHDDRVLVAPHAPG